MVSQGQNYYDKTDETASITVSDQFKITQSIVDCARLTEPLSS